MQRTALRRVLFLEFNEITWSLIDPLIAQGALPHFARLKHEGTWATPESNDLSPYLNPWITWVTVHTGVERSVHGASILEQAIDTIHAKRSWEYAVEAGLSVGVFGSIGSYPPRPVNGFWVPGPFAPASDTFPPELQPLQELNRKYTRAHNRGGAKDSWVAMVRQGLQLLRFGLKPSTICCIIRQLIHEKCQPHMSWKRVTMQSLVNGDFFVSLYQRFRPDYATWHTNHVAHYMHHYWRAMDDTPFLTPATPEEKQRYGGAVEYGYQIADQILGRLMRIVDENTVLVLASSMGQQPYVTEQYPAGRITVRMRDIHQILRIVGAQGVKAVAPMMAQEWNVTIPDPLQRAQVKHTLLRAYSTGEKHEVFSVAEEGEILCIAPRGVAKPEPDVEVIFQDGQNMTHHYTFDELFVTDDPTPKEGVHHPQGVLAFWGKGIRQGVEIRHTTNLDIAPTILTLLGVVVPPIMQGHVLAGAWEEQPAVPVAGSDAAGTASDTVPTAAGF
jgi:predicted AlkP superfamily phosphohydrolase/phosphomutase